MRRPIEIIGGGLAGLSIGLALQKRGIPVRIIEAGEFPRHRVCGEFISGLDSRTTTELGLTPFLADALQHREVAWCFGRRPPHVSTLPQPALGISRHVLDARLAQAFVSAGGTLCTGTRVADLRPSPGRVHATGRVRGRSAWMGLKVHAHGLQVIRDLEMHLGQGAYVGLARVDAATVNICGLFRRRAIDSTAARGTELGPESEGRALHVLREFLLGSGLDHLAERLGCGSIVGGSFCAVAALSFSTRPSIPGRISLGDAYAMIPPFTGNGMAMAFQSAAIALEPLRLYACGKAGWEQTCAATNAALRRRFRTRLLSARLLHPFLLRPSRQRWLATLSGAGLLPFRPLYAMVH